MRIIITSGLEIESNFRSFFIFSNFVLFEEYLDMFKILSIYEVLFILLKVNGSFSIDKIQREILVIMSSEINIIFRDIYFYYLLL